MAMIDKNDFSIIQSTLKWVEILNQNSDKIRIPSSTDARKSSLLARLLSGKDPLPFPPPCSFSYPWYEIVESIEPVVVDDTYGIWFEPDDSFVIINQNRFDIVIKFTDTMMVIQDSFKKTPYRFLLCKADVKSDCEIWLLKNIISVELLNTK